MACIYLCWLVPDFKLTKPTEGFQGKSGAQ